MNMPKPTPPTGAPHPAENRTPLAWSKVKNEPYYALPINIDVGVRARTITEARAILAAEVARVNAQIDALAELDEQEPS